MSRYTLHKYIPRLMAVLLVLILLVGAIPTVYADGESGTCGDNLNWSLTGDTLIITGYGAMYDFPESTMAPWYPYRGQIAAVQLPDGLTRIGNLAFYDCHMLASVFLPDSVTEIGRYAFAGCTSMTMLDLGGGLRVIEESGFRECTSLLAVRLPGSLTSIGSQAFERCESLTEITVPASVTQMGGGIFSFCYQLVRADIRAQLNELPDWTFYSCSQLKDLALPSALTCADAYAFYGCTGLTDVEYAGSAENLEQIKANIERDLEGNAGMIAVSDRENEKISSSVVFEETGNSIVSNTTTAARTENASLGANVTVTHPKDNTGNTSSAQVDVTLENADGWNEVSGTVTEIVESADIANIDVYIKDDSVLSAGTMAGLAEKNVTVTVHTASGSAWKIDCEQLDAEEEQAAYDLSYEREAASEEQTEQMNCTDGYQLHFNDSTVVNAEVLIRLPVDNAGKTATLYQVEHNDELTKLQSVLVDDSGYAHFYLGAVDNETEYLLGMNVPGEKSSALIPESQHGDYGIIDADTGIEYVITGRTSSWGMNINQVTWILVGVLTASVIIVGIVMYMLNKRRLKNGYIPDMDDE